MKRKTRLPELLAPAGSIEAFYAAVEAGADAVYLGLAEGSSNARVGAENFSRESLAAILPYAHAKGVRVYLTLNTMTYENEMEDTLSLARFACEAGVDALIVADLGLASRIAREIPDMPLHASTQAFAHSTLSADALYKLGFSRVVLARESSRENIRSVTEHSLAETEVFLHGALCVSHSGQCLFSSMLGGRSGNRGACAQPCRKAYGKAGYALSLKDFCLARHIPALIEDGVASLKIEGRMKSASYVYTVTGIYRRLLDEGRAASDAEMKELESAFSRSGFTDGYYTGRLAKGMTGIRTERDKQASRSLGEKSFSPLPVGVTGHAVFKKDTPVAFSLSLRLNDGTVLSADAQGTVPLTAERAALEAEGVKARLSRLGGDGFHMESLTLSLDEGLFLPVGAQNALRRDAAEGLKAALRHHREKNAVHPQEGESAEKKTPLRTAVFHRAEGYAASLSHYFDIVFLPHTAFDKPSSVNGVTVPPVVFDSECKEILSYLRKAKQNGVVYALVSSLGAIALAREAGLIPIGDYRLNIANKESERVYRAMGLSYFILSPELSSARARHLSGGYTVYGRIPLMLTERCFVKDTFGCAACGKAALTDERGARFPMLRTHGHRTTIFNSLPTYLGDTVTRDGALSGLGEHFIFSTESPEEAERILAAYERREPLTVAVRRAYK